MSVILSKDGGTPGAYALVVDEIPAENAAQLQSDVTALVFGIGNPAKLYSDEALENFLRNMAGCFTGRIAAIKAVRYLTKPALGLKEAKDFVESVESKFGFKFDANRPL